MGVLQAGLPEISIRQDCQSCCRSPARKQHLGLPGGAAGAMDAHMCIVPKSYTVMMAIVNSLKVIRQHQVCGYPGNRMPLGSLLPIKET